MGKVVFFETSTLVAASVRALEGNVQHDRYSESKGLVNQAAKREIMGITTLNIEEQTNKALEKALLDVMKKPPDTADEFKNYALILDAIQRMYFENISFMDRLSTNKDEVTKIEVTEVYPMYDELDSSAREKPEKTYSISHRFKGVARDVNRIEFGRYKQKMKQLQEKSIIPDYYDRIILSEAVYLKRNRFQNETFYLSSLDNHFSGLRAPYTQIPETIKENFDIDCQTLSKIMALLRGNSS